jgi:uncharacterized protein YgiM (DUF1202 family)
MPRRLRLWKRLQRLRCLFQRPRKVHHILPPERLQLRNPTAAETPRVSEAPVAITTSPRATYQVIGIPAGDYLNVREQAGSDHEVITRLEPGTGGILLGTKRITTGATTWQEITVHGQTGWVNAAYIARETQLPVSPTESSTAPSGQ